MKKHLYLHIGVHKTATTSIQAGLQANAPALATAGYYHPRQARAIDKEGHHNAAWAITGDKRFVPARGTIQDIIAEVQQQALPNSIISSEDFSLIARPRKLDTLAQALLEHLDVTIIIYLRRQDKLLQSLWTESAKNGHYAPLLSEIDRVEDITQNHLRMARYADVINRWEAAFGRERIQVHLFDEVVRQGDIFLHFLNACGLQNTNGISRAVVINESPSAKTLSVIRAVAGRMQPKYYTYPYKYRLYLVWKEVNHYAERQGWNDSKFNMLDEATSRRIMDYFAEGNAQIARHYFDRETLFDETFAHKPITPLDDTLFTAADVLDVAAIVGDTFALYASDAGPQHSLVMLQQRNEELTQQLQDIKGTRGWQWLMRYWELRDRILGR